MTRTWLLVLLAITLPVFAFLTLQIAADGPVTQFDRAVSSQWEEHGRTAPALVTFFRVLTFLGGAPFLAVLTAAVMILLNRRGEGWLALALAGTVAGNFLLNWVAKELVRRPRPEFAVPLVEETSWSFPSGHSMSALVVYGMLAYVLAVGFSLGRWRPAVFGGLALLILGIGCSRVYLGAHWPSDVVAGFAGGTIWLACCIWATEQARWRFQTKTV